MLPNDVAIMAFADGGMAAGRRVRRRLRPRRRAVDRAAMRTNGNCVGKLALCRKVAGDVLVVGGHGAEFFAGAFMRIEHDYGFPRALQAAAGGSLRKTRRPATCSAKNGATRSTG